jgi:hypothetical protein
MANVNKSRILLWLLAAGAVMAAVALFAASQSRLPHIDQRVVCEDLPPNMQKIGPALTPAKSADAISSYGQDWNVAMRPGDTVHEFETGVTGGHLVLRGNCYVGQALAWIR